MSDQYTFDDGPAMVAFRAQWDQVVKTLGERLPATTMSKFIQPLRPDSVENNTAILAATSVFVQDWVRDKYLDTLQEELSNVAGHSVKLEIRFQVKERTKLEGIGSIGPVRSRPILAPDLPLFQPNPKQTFETFVMGGANRMAGAGAMAVGDSPGVKYNPLFIYSRVGLGKTHLLNAIANRLLKSQPQLGVVYMSGQKFTEDFVAAVQNNRVDQFRRNIRSAGVWLLDDVQFILGKDKTQEEVFHAFNHLHSLERQIVVCSDRPPRELLGAAERLRSRFEMGLVVDIQIPDTETRTAIILKKAEQEGHLLSPAVALTIAEAVSGNIRHLEGALNRVMALADMEGRDPYVELAKEVCEKYYTSMAPVRPSVTEIIEAVCREYKANKQDVLGVSRKAQITQVRHVAVYVLREITGDSWKNIGDSLGKKDHTTMMHGYKKIREMMDRDRELSASINALINDLYPDG